jgi:CRISPR-associated protein (TIGR03984 family)
MIGGHADPTRTGRTWRPAVDAPGAQTVLYGAATTGVALPEALAAAGLDGGCALLTSPTAYRVARVTGGVCLAPPYAGSTGRARPSRQMDVSAVYEARAFTADRELRWIEPGYAVLLTEDQRLLPASFPERLDDLPVVDTLEAGYLIWGTASVAASGWTRLRSPRVGELAVPMTGRPEGGRVRLVAREYLAADPVHGTAYVAEERLLGFEPYTAEGAVD